MDDEDIEELEDLAVDVASSLPMPPIPALPAMGFPQLPPFNISLPQIPSLPSFIEASPDDLAFERLMELVVALGLEVDLDLDPDVPSLISEMLEAAREQGAGQLAKLQAEVIATQAAAVPEVYLPPIPPVTGIPMMGFPLLPPFNVMLPEVPGLPSFMATSPQDLLIERLMELVAELGLEVDLELGLDTSTLISEMLDAARDLSPEALAKLQAEIAAATAAAVPKVYLPPIPPITGIPMLGFPMLPSFNFDLALDIDNPLSKLVEWG